MSKVVTVSSRRLSLHSLEYDKGVSLRPTIWVAFVHLVLTELASLFSVSWVMEHLTIFADDTHMGWTASTEDELHSSQEQAGTVTQLLETMGLSANTDKSAFLYTIGAKAVRKLSRTFSVRVRRDKSRPSKQTVSSGNLQWLRSISIWARPLAMTTLRTILWPWE